MSNLFSIPSKVNSTQSSTKNIVNKLVINIHVKIYREVLMHVMHCLSKVSRSSEDSLVDVRANGVVAGNNVRVIAKHPDVTVDARGIDNH